MLRDRLKEYRKAKMRLAAKQAGGNVLIPPLVAVKNKTVNKGRVDALSEESKHDEFKSPSPK
jgi:hypothetical protein